MSSDDGGRLAPMTTNESRARFDWSEQAAANWA